MPRIISFSLRRSDPENIGPYITIDETAVSQGELYTVLTNKAANGRKGCLIAIIKGTDSERIKSVLLRKIPLEKRRLVKEVTLDMAAIPWGPVWSRLLLRLLQKPPWSLTVSMCKSWLMMLFSSTAARDANSLSLGGD